ncbi:MAG: protein-glutamate O-methyltransferase CheR [Acidobacteria bacterium]|nr:protein-glutamate O-methyltransferase CheR [Acidobacteriota bacterium]
MSAIGEAGVAALGAEEFRWICRFLRDRTGISLRDGKQAMVMGRLEKRLRRLGLSSYGAYFARLGKPGEEAETRIAIDLLTTNETFFFREPKHFDFLRETIVPAHPRSRLLRVWSAASSSGEEAYTIAMTLAEHLPDGGWEVVGTDISTRVLETARGGLYPIAAAQKIPVALLRRYCLKGCDEYEGYLRIGPELRSRVAFVHANLLQPLQGLGVFDVVFLRNVMIYFDVDTKQDLLRRIAAVMRPGAYLFTSHSESLSGLDTGFEVVAPSIYRRPEDAARATG